MSIRKIMAIFNKQVKDTLKNKSVFIQFIMFPIMTVIMQKSVNIDGMSENFFVILFASMYLAMAPITSMASIISEEKEKNTLRVLLMSNVKPLEFLVGIGSYVFLICIIGSLVFAIIGQYKGAYLLQFMFIMIIGIFISILLGASIGIYSKNQMMATSVTVPVMMIVSFLPMLSTFNEKIEKIGYFVYSQQINILINKIGIFEVNTKSIIIITANIIFMIFFFIFIYRKKGLN